jgi:hypothetical protein
VPRGRKPIGNTAMTATERTRRHRMKRAAARANQGLPGGETTNPLALAGDFDPRDVLRSIAADPGAPAAARVAACRTLIGQEGPGSADPRRKVDELALRFLRSIN